MRNLSTSVQSAASIIGVSRTSIYRLIKDGKIDTVKVRGRRLVKTESLRALVGEDA